MRPTSHALLPVALLLYFNAKLGASNVDEAWATYVKEVYRNATNGIQSACTPQHWAAQGEYRGAVLLYHGYSACPQQYGQLAPLLAARGLEVFVPLIPGMGNNFNADGPSPPRWKCPLKDCNGPLDLVLDMANNTQDYVDFSNRMNAIMSLAAAPRMVSGISVGATLASYGGQAMLDGKALYTRQLILNPMIDGAAKRNEEALRVLNSNPLTRQLWLGWGTGCRKERSLGRGGICTFEVQNAMAAGDFGKYVTYEGLQVPNDTNVVVAYDQGDPVVDTAYVRKLASKYREQVPATESCLFNFTLHSMLSKWDDVGTNRWWTNEVYCNMVEYLAAGVPFQTSSATNSTEGGEHYCSLQCSAESCPYNITAPLTCPFTPPVADGSIR